MKKILIISHSDDGTSQLLMKRLDELGSKYHLIDLSQLPMRSVASISYQGGMKFGYREDEKFFSHEDVKSVWWRRPYGKFREDKRTSLHEYIRTESDAFATSLFYLLPISSEELFLTIFYKQQNELFNYFRIRKYF